jgi:hypothetical protein
VNTAGISISNGKDFNGDENVEFVISSMFSSTSLCVINVVRLSSEGKSKNIFVEDFPKSILLRINGLLSFSVGLSLTGLGDINYDGINDLLVVSDNFHFNSSALSHFHIKLVVLPSSYFFVFVRFLCSSHKDLPRSHCYSCEYHYHLVLLFLF